MKAFRLISIAAVFALAASCMVQEQMETVINNAPVFLAEIEGSDVSDTKAYADANLKVLWHEDDRVSIFNKLTYNQQYKFDGSTGDNSGSFSLIPDELFVTGNELDCVYAVYPYSAATAISNSGVLTINLPATQAYAECSFGRGANAMVAASSDNILVFKNLCGYLMFKFYGEGLSVSSIKLTSTGGEALAGTALVNATPGAAPTAKVTSNASSELVLDCADPVALGATADSYTEFWFAIPPVTMSQGFSILITLSDGRTFEKSLASSVTITRNRRSRMAALEVVPDPVQAVGELWYTTISGNPIVPNDPSAFGGAAIVSNVYENGKGLISFDSALTEIGYRAFFDCADLASVTIPDSVVSIGEGAFLGCGFTTVNIPDSVENLAEGAFAVCRSLESFTGRYATTDGACLVKDNVLLAYTPAKNNYYYVIPSGIERIGMEAFAECINLNTVLIPASVNNIGYLAFASSTGLNSVIIDSATPPVCQVGAFDGTSDCPILVPVSSVDIYKSSAGWFVYAERITSPSTDVGKAIAQSDGSPVNLRAKVYAIGSRGIIVSDGEAYLLVYTTDVECSIGDEIQVRGTKITYRNNPEITNICQVVNVLSEGHDVTVNSYTDITSNLDSFVADSALPAKVTGVVEVNGSSYYIKPENSQKRVYIYWPVSSLRTRLGELVGSAVTLYGFYLFNYNAEVDILPVSVEEVQDEVQPDNEIWYTTTDGNIVEPLNSNSFGAAIVSNSYADGRGIIVFDGPVTMLGDKSINASDMATFSGCTNLETISLPSTVRSIGSYAFYRCSNMVSVSLPDELDYIGIWLFAYADNLTEVTIPSVTSHISGDPIGPCASLTTIKGEYASSDGKCLVYKGKLRGFARGGMTDYQIPDGITSLGTQCFCSSQLQRVTIPDSVLEIDKTSFEDCSYLEAFLGKYASGDGRCLIVDGALLAFAGKGITEYTISDGISNLCRAFDRTNDLLTLYIPSSVNRIEYMNSVSLKTIYIYSTVPPSAGPLWINPDAIYVPNASLEDYKAAQNWSRLSECIRPLAPEPEAVDLGLTSGTRWASWNLGASSKSQYGTPFAWGEIMTKSSFSWATYKWGDAANHITKYNLKEGDDGYDNKSSLDPEDDAATVLLGSGWMIPSKANWDELKSQCDWAEDTLDGVQGYTVTSRTNGNAIFLPVGGMVGGNVKRSEEEGWYWISELSGAGPQGYYTYGKAFCVRMIGLSNTHSGYGTERINGCVIRPVRL